MQVCFCPQGMDDPAARAGLAPGSRERSSPAGSLRPLPIPVASAIPRLRRRLLRHPAGKTATENATLRGAFA